MERSEPATKITRADVGDAETILALQRLAFEMEARRNHDWTIPALTETLDELRTSIATRIVLKAVIDARIIGSVRARLEAGTCHVSRTMVHPDYERRGVASSLMMRIEKHFPTAKRFALVTGSRSDGNIRFYERHGYRTIGTEVVSPQTSIVLMEKVAAGAPGSDAQ